MSNSILKVEEKEAPKPYSISFKLSEFRWRCRTICPAPSLSLRLPGARSRKYYRMLMLLETSMWTGQELVDLRNSPTVPRTIAHVFFRVFLKFPRKHSFTSAACSPTPWSTERINPREDAPDSFPPFTSPSRVCPPSHNFQLLSWSTVSVRASFAAVFRSALASS